MAIAAEDIHGTMPFDAAFGDDGSAGRRTDRTPPATPISRARFLDHVDASVRYLAAWLLAELTHARTLTPTVMLPVERSS